MAAEPLALLVAEPAEGYALLDCGDGRKLERFGPVRSVAPKLVLEVAFEGLNASGRHKAGVAMRFPRISRIRWDKPAVEADHLSTLKAMIP